MTAPAKFSDRNSLLLQAYETINALEARLISLEQRQTEPIAVVGIGCRFPGCVDSPEAYWRMLDAGREGVVQVPPSRWNLEEFYDPDPDAPGKMYARHGGFVEHIDELDARFFGIAPREAVSMDPQQRLLLEVAWEALEHAGEAPEGLAGGATGVFVGISANDHARRQIHRDDPCSIEPHTGTGNACSIAAGRLSYVLGLHGPSIAVDTACSSSLVAVHLACQSLRAGECRAALACGVNAIVTPHSSIIVCKLRMLAADGRCKTFDAAADGFVRGEGCGVIVLKRLTDAQADGNRILAVIRGSALNQDGRSSGLTAPNGTAQEALLRKAVAAAGIEPNDVSYVEAHGTGTSLGDPVEVRALGAVYCANRVSERPLVIGSVKTNIGHLESASGMAGLIKLVLALQHGKIPPHLHFRRPSPHIDWDALPIRVPTTGLLWPAVDKPRIGGVSAFGFSGTNAHVIVQEPPPTVPPAAPGIDGVAVCTLSAKDPQALRDLAGRYAEYLRARPELRLADVCFTANTGRSHFPHRLAWVGNALEDLCNQLSQFAGGRGNGELYAGIGKSTPPRIAFLFPGQGSPWPGMGLELLLQRPTKLRLAMQ